MALRSGLTLKASNSNLICVENVNMDSIKTKDFVKVLSALGIERKALFVVDVEEDFNNAYMSLSPTMKLFGTAINDGFGDVEETGILIAVDEILQEKRMRHIDTFAAEHPELVKITSGANRIFYKPDDK